MPRLNCSPEDLGFMRFDCTLTHGFDSFLKTWCHSNNGLMYLKRMRNLIQYTQKSIGFSVLFFLYYYCIFKRVDLIEFIEM